MDIDLISYIPEAGKPSERLLHVLRGLSVFGRMHIMKTYRDLQYCLRQKSGSMSIILILLITDMDLFDELAGVLQHFNIKRVVLILPDDKKETLQLGFSIYPRYISYIQGDFSDVAAVIEKMATATQRERSAYSEKCIQLREEEYKV